MDRVEALRAEIGELLDLPLPDSDEALLGGLVELHRAQAQLSALKAKFMAAADARKSYARDGSKSLGAWLARQCHASKAVTGREARSARRSQVMPLTSEALAAGEIGEEHALVLEKLAASPRQVVTDRFGEAEGDLVGFAKALYFEDFLVAVKYWTDVVDPDGAEDDADRAHDRREVHLSETTGGFELKGRLEPIPGTELHTALSRIEDELFKEDWAAATEANGGEKPTKDQLKRTHAQRRADALVEMAKRAMAMPEGAQKPEPLVTAGWWGSRRCRAGCVSCSTRPRSPRVRWRGCSTRLRLSGWCSRAGTGSSRSEHGPGSSPAAYAGPSRSATGTASTPDASDRPNSARWTTYDRGDRPG